MTTGQWASSISGRHLTTKEADADAGLYYFWARWYDSRIGLFQSKDPLVYFNGYQAYRYCLNSPLAYFDPLGLMHFPYGDGELCTDGGCKKECTDGFKSKPEDSNPGDPLEDVPEPGKCASSDGV
jgi:RHS repeat-associated protein